MHDRDAARAGRGFEPCTQRAFKLRRQVDFRHEHQDVSPLGEHLLRRVQVDLGFAAACDAKEQGGRKPGCSAHGIDSRLLRLVQGGSEAWLQRLHSGHAPFIQPGDGPRPGALALVIRHPAQGLWKCGQDDLAQGSLVIVRSETGKSQPTILHRLDIAQNRLDRLDLIGVMRRCLGAFDHHADKLPTPERHDHAGPDRYFFVTPVIERPLKRQVDDHSHPIRMIVGFCIRKGHGSGHEVKVISWICR